MWLFSTELYLGELLKWNRLVSPDMFGHKILSTENPATELGYKLCHLKLMTSLKTAEPEFKYGWLNEVKLLTQMHTAVGQDEYNIDDETHLSIADFL